MQASTQGLGAIQDTVTQETRVPRSRQSLVVVEERNRSLTLQTFKRFLVRQLDHSRRDAKGFLLGWANFLMCPEAFAR